HIARRIENSVAADKQILIGAKREAGRATIIDLGRRLERGSVRIDPIDSSGRRRSGYRGDREIEPAVVGVPHWLFGATGGGSESDPLSNGEGSGDLVDADKGAKRYSVSVVYYQEQPKLRGIRQFIRPVGIIGGRDDVSARCNQTSPQ